MGIRVWWRKIKRKEKEKRKRKRKGNVWLKERNEKYNLEMLPQYFHNKF